MIRWPVGGIRTWCRYVYSHPAFRDFELTVAAPGHEFTELLADDLAAHGVNVITLSNDTPKFVLEVRRLVASSEWSLIHSHGFTAAATTALVALGGSVPHLVTQHDVMLADQYRGLKGGLQRRAVSIALRSADRIHSVSDAASRNLVENFPRLENSDKITVITNGIESSRFVQAQARDVRTELELDSSDFLIGFFGRFMGQKGFRYLAEAVRILRKEHSSTLNPVVISAAGGGFLDREKRELEATGVAESFRFVPFAANLAPLLKAVDVVVMPSLWEACGLLAMETLAAGTPLIVSDCPSLVAISEDSPAVVVPKADARGLAVALLHEATSPTRPEAAAYARTAAERFDVVHMAVAMAELYKTPAGLRDGRPGRT